MNVMRFIQDLSADNRRIIAHCDAILDDPARRLSSRTFTYIERIQHTARRAEMMLDLVGEPPEDLLRMLMQDVHDPIKMMDGFVGLILQNASDELNRDQHTHLHAIDALVTGMVVAVGDVATR